MSILLRHSAEVDLDVGLGRTALSFILILPRVRDTRVKEKLKEKISLLMRYSSRLDFNSSNAYYESPLVDEMRRSIESGDFEFLEFILSIATEQNLSADHLELVLELACEEKSFECVKLLLEYGASSEEFPELMDDWVSATLDDRHGQTGFFHNHDTEFESLLTMWINFNPGLNDKGVYFMTALRYRDKKAVDFFLSRGIARRDQECHDPIEWLQEAACWSHLGVLRRLLQGSPNINGFDGENDLPLSRAVKAGHREAVLLLMEHGADAYKSKDTGNGQKMGAILKPIQHAIRRGDVGILAAILDKHEAPLSKEEAWIPAVLSSAPDIAVTLALHPSLFM
ncbi:ankyrin repeat-containing domain protein [Rostrohypoxylon terebratum]|nr:ankyrin repeat-containing domain protein [Rostrohypoxylon terebratum]